MDGEPATFCIGLFCASVGRDLAATSEKLALLCYLVDITKSSIYGGLDVLIHAEQVGWVIRVLEGHQPCVVGPV
jgi:hypothetical protein